MATPAMASSVLSAKIRPVKAKRLSRIILNKGRLPETKQQIIEMALNGSKVPDDYDVSEQGITVEMDEMWSYVGSKANQRWLWHAIDRATGEVLAYVLGKPRDEVFLELKGLSEPFGITHFYTDDWGAYERHLESEKHIVGKQNTQK